MAHQTEIVVNGVVTEVTEFDHTAQEIDDSVDRAMLSLLAVAAAVAYNPSGTYVIGDYCTNDGNLYKCNTPIESGEPWNSEHWTETTVAAELAEVRASLSNKLGYIKSDTGFTDLSDMPDESCVCLTSKTDITGLPDGWPTTGRNTFVRFRPGNKQYALDFLLSYNSDKLAYRIPSRPWREIPTATPPQRYTLPLADGWVRVNAAEYWKTQEGVVIVTFRVAPENGVAIDTNTKIIATLPEGFRPAGYMPHISAATMKSGEKGNDAQAWINETGNIYAQAVTPIPETSGGSPTNWGGFAGTFIFVANS